MADGEDCKQANGKVTVTRPEVKLEQSFVSLLLIKNYSENIV